jgi:phosphoglycerate-specific signal transduction histidine kinase
MDSSQKFNILYTDVSKSIAAATADIADLKVEHADGKKELGQIMEKLRAIQARFDGELDMLKQHAEWDKFTMAFFGETNAGKSTIIESLRILFKENARQQLLEQSAQDLVKYEQALTGHVQQVRDGLSKVYTEYTAEIVAIKKGTAVLGRVLEKESAGRMRPKLLLFAAAGFLSGAVAAIAIAMLLGRIA